MRAIRFHQFGPPTSLQHEEVTDPMPGADELLVEIKATAINPSDVKNVQGLMPHTTLPRTPGRDFAGVVVQGPDEMIGTEVWGSGGDLGFSRDGAHAAFLLLPRDAVRPKPANLSFEQAAAVGVPFVTAWSALADAGQFSAHDAVLIIGAAGAVGSAAVQIARWRGARVLGVVRNEDQRSQIEQTGAEAVVSTDPNSLPDTVRAATDGHGATLILDTVGGLMFESSLQSLAPRGRLVEITTTQRRVSFDLLDFYRRELRLLGVNTLSLDATTGARILDALRPGFESGVLQAPSIAERYPLSQASQAYERVGAAKGKVLLLPD
jgi:NADPH2:quinone reductase